MTEFSRRLAIFAAVLTALMILGCATVQDFDYKPVLDGVTGAELDEATVLAGLKDALTVGTSNTVTRTSAVDGYLGNDLIRIALPDKLQEPASTLRSVGLGSYVDEFEVAMNRAAEQAAGEARDIFWDAVTAMTIQDAFGILNGADTAATDYFRIRTQANLRSKFLPIVTEKTASVKLGSLYAHFSGAYETLPLTSKPDLIDLDAYVTDQALQGLYSELALEEQAIRNDPAARTTELLRRVFGQ